MRRSSRILATAFGLSLVLGAGYSVAENGQSPEVSAGPAAIAATSAVLALEEALKDSVWQVRTSAVAALGRLGAPAVPVLTEVLKDPVWQVRAAAARALGRLGAPAVPALTGALKDSVWQVRAAAAQALGQERSDR
jgi:HEAT repeat protein